MKNMFAKRPEIKEEFQILINIGIGFDIPTGTFITGLKGESILNGGFSPYNAIAGKGNTYKSTITHYKVLNASARISEYGAYTTVEGYDSENSVNGSRLNTIASHIPLYKGVDLVKEGVWRLKKASQMAGDVWYKELKEALKEKSKNKKQYTITTPFKDEDGNTVEMMFPCFSEIDSLSHFKASVILDMEEKNELGDSGGNTIFMRSGLLKSRLLGEFGTLCGKNDHYTIMTAHIGKKFEMATGPMAPKPSKDMQFGKIDEKTKNVPDGFDFLPNVVYHVNKANVMVNRDTKLYEYPAPGEEETKNGIDLNEITLKCIRNKYGPSGFELVFVVSQREGVLPEVTDFHSLRTAGEGVKNAGAWWNCELCPDIKFTRNSLRQVVKDEPKLKRALEICREISQMKTFMMDLIQYPTFADLYEKLEADYGWDKLLDTRGYWVLNQYDHPVPFLSSLDILKMYHGQYTPYWWKK